MKLKVLIKLSSLILIVGCAEGDPKKITSADKQDTSVVSTEANLYSDYDCNTFPKYDWVGNTEKNKAFLSMALNKIHDLEISGFYTGQDASKTKCEVSIYTDNTKMTVQTNKKSGLKLNLQDNYKIQSFSCSASRIRYNLIYDNPKYGNTEYFSIVFSPETGLLKEVFFDTQSMGPNNSLFECASLQRAQVNF